MACGYFIQSNTIPVYVRWTKYAAYVVGLLFTLLKSFTCIRDFEKNLPHGVCINIYYNSEPDEASLPEAREPPFRI